MKKGLINCIITIILIAVFVQYAGYLVRPLDTDGAIASINAFHTLPEHSLEVIGFGSSHMWRGMDPRVMYEEYGIGAYNYGCNWQKCNTTSLFIQDALRTQSPKVVVIEAYFLYSLLQDTDMNGEIYYTKAIPESPAKWHYLKQCFGDDWERYLSYYMPLAAFHDKWTNISRQSFNKRSEGNEFWYTLGFVPSGTVTEIVIPEQKTEKKINKQALSEIDYIVQLCKEKNIEVVFYVAPYEGEFVFTEAMSQLASNYGYPFLNLFALREEIGIDGNTDFSDAMHLNTAGSQKVARYLGQYLSDYYDLTDMREVQGNFWESQLHVSG
ncbi:MAG: hypothetical protein J6J12_02460 [Oscillospiraceae bacterium]|nr:hypothetical protein [Oscillospiraceae bacterium]